MNPSYSPRHSKRVVFLDRDGTINVDHHYLSSPDQFEFIPGVIEALQSMRDQGFRLVVVTNQSGVGRGYYTEADMHEVHAKMNRELKPHGIEFDRIYAATEAPEAKSRGRKPSPAFLLDARDEFGFSLSDSYMIGDKIIDVECGRNAGVRRSILVRTGYGREVEQKHPAELAAMSAVVVDDLAAAARWIAKDRGGSE